jgi:hypothetical protein
MRLVSVALLLSAASGAFAGENPPLARYAFVPTAEGALRLDTETGEVSLCTSAGNGVACTRVAENIRLTLGERARLEAEVAALGARVADLESERQALGGGNAAMARVKVLAGRIMQHFLDVVNSMKHGQQGEL